ncbi:MAG: beta-lactamase family protein [Ferruginibacter sp.]|nr:beta-lactamase family protein [Cytophagales bacterium]
MRLLLISLTVWITLSEISLAQTRPKSLFLFEQQIQQACQQLRIPGTTAAVARGDSIIWLKSFGQADVKRDTPTDALTSYHVASLTKTFAGIVMMRLVEAGKLRLDDPVTNYTNQLPAGIQVKHLLTHTSEGTPGNQYSYNGYRFHFLDEVILKASGRSFTHWAQKWIIDPLGLASTVPNVSLQEYYDYRQENPPWLKRFDQAFAHLAKPYRLNDKEGIEESFYEPYAGVSAGIISTVGDLVRYSAALDADKLLSPALRQQMYTPFRTNDGRTTPYGYGWFIQEFQQKRLLWHYGQDRSNSALLMKVPDQGLTFVILANSIHLSLPFGLGTGDVTQSPFAQAFLQYVAFPDQLTTSVKWNEDQNTLQEQLVALQNKPNFDFYVNCLLAQAAIAGERKDSVRLGVLYNLHYQLKGNRLPSSKEAIASLDKIGNNQDRTQRFTLPQSTKLRVVTVGEISPTNHQTWDWGWIEDEAGKKIWEMTWTNSRAAGREAKIRSVDTTLVLSKGDYRLRYKSDDGYSYQGWGNLPPDIPLYGIALFKP